jgi:hypothetical protein
MRPSKELESTIKMLKDIFKDMNIEKYQDSWSLMKEDGDVPDCLRNPESDLDDDDDDIDDDIDDCSDDDIGIGCNDCYACVSGGSKPCQKHPPLK